VHSKKLAPKLALAALALSGAAFAQTKPPEPDYTLAANVGVVSDYRFRGIAQTSKKPAIQGGIDFSHKSGFYLGAWASNVKWVKDFNGATKGSYELDLYGGYKGSINDDFSYDVGLITYRYPGNNSGDLGTPGGGFFSHADTNEWYVAGTYKMATLKYNRTMGNLLGNLNSGGSSYFDLSAGFDVGNGFTVTPHVGHQTVKNLSVASYTDYSLTATKDFGNGFAASVAYVGSNARKAFYTDFNGKFIGNDTIVVGVKYTYSF
jgi:uncharacterized protein (TIGR02001 family)